MVFPYDACTADSLKLLKKHDFNMAMCASGRIPDPAKESGRDFGMKPAVMDFYGFALAERYKCTYKDYIFDLFLNRPVVLYSHQGLFSKGMDAFNPIAEEINGLCGKVEWRSLGDIARHLYLKKSNKDGTIDVEMYSSEIELCNEAASERLYHVCKKEGFEVPVKEVTVNGIQARWFMKKDVLCIDVKIPGNSSIIVRARYSDDLPGRAKFPTGPFSNLKKAGIKTFLSRCVPSFVRDKWLMPTWIGRKVLSLYYVVFKKGMNE
jgi:hypothetical protein